VLRDTTICFPTDRPVALLGENNEDLTVILYMLSGATVPDGGEIVAGQLRASPLIHAGGVPGATLVPHFSAADNVRLLGDLHGIDQHQLRALVEVVCRLGSSFHVPVAKLERGKRRALEMNVMAALPFDCYFVDRLHSAAGPHAWRLLTTARKRGAGVVFSTQLYRQALRITQNGAIVQGGSIHLMSPLPETLASYGNPS
jgi:ABC-type polysaccharide/polyol phosphate transport system ATPase subunit